MNEWNVFEQDKIKLIGRSDRSSGVFHMDWTGSCVEFAVRGSHAEVQMTAVNDGKEQWVLFEIDGTPSARIRLLNGTHWYTILNSKGYPQSHRFVSMAKRSIRIFKESQAHNGDKNAAASCDRIRVDGELCDPPVRRKIEFIGDSLTAGEGALSPRLTDIGSAVSIDEWSTSYYAWTGRTARLLNADFQIVAQGGWGVYCGWDNNRNNNIPSIYEKICGVVRQPWAQERGADKPYDFSFRPDMIVINLGTNDNSGFNQPAWKNPATGESLCLRRAGLDGAVAFDAYPETDEDYLEEDKDKVVQAIVAFVKTIVLRNPGASIFWAYGMMGSALWPTIRKAAGILHGEGVTQLNMIELPDTPHEQYGANSHPLAAAHEKCAGIIAGEIREQLKI